jgi:hypothetical protein
MQELDQEWTHTGATRSDAALILVGVVRGHKRVPCWGLDRDVHCR